MKYSAAAAILHISLCVRVVMNSCPGDFRERLPPVNKYDIISYERAVRFRHVGETFRKRYRYYIVSFRYAITSRIIIFNIYIYISNIRSSSIRGTACCFLKNFLLSVPTQNRIRLTFPVYLGADKLSIIPTPSYPSPFQTSFVRFISFAYSRDNPSPRVRVPCGLR